MRNLPPLECRHSCRQKGPPSLPPSLPPLLLDPSLPLLHPLTTWLWRAPFSSVPRGALQLVNSDAQSENFSQDVGPRSDFLSCLGWGPRFLGRFKRVRHSPLRRRHGQFHARYVAGAVRARDEGGDPAGGLGEKIQQSERQSTESCKIIPARLRDWLAEMLRSSVFLGWQSVHFED